jgi:hypothetical protein
MVVRWSPLRSAGPPPRREPDSNDRAYLGIWYGSRPLPGPGCWVEDYGSDAGARTWKPLRPNPRHDLR